MAPADDFKSAAAEPAPATAAASTEETPASSTATTRSSPSRKAKTTGSKKDEVVAKEEAPKTKKSSKKSEAASKSSSDCGPSYFELIVNAIKELKDRNGSSRQAIGKLVETKKGNYASHHLNKALRTAVDSGKLIQTKGSYKLSPELRKPSAAMKKSHKVSEKAAKTVAKVDKGAKKASAAVKKATATAAAVAKKKKNVATKKVAAKKAPAKKTSSKKVPVKKAPASKKVSAKTIKKTVKKTAKKSDRFFGMSITVVSFFFFVGAHPIVTVRKVNSELSKPTFCLRQVYLARRTKCDVVYRSVSNARCTFHVILSTISLSPPCLCLCQSFKPTHAHVFLWSWVRPTIGGLRRGYTNGCDKPGTWCGTHRKRSMSLIRRTFVSYTLSDYTVPYRLWLEDIYRNRAFIEAQ
uniref:H15 domain-containing protein n=1 Tax=Hyaloperonospora arabidopsidis (strain Emoy2) TaxID=559515 RepID=M4BR62_HYAAE